MYEKINMYKQIKNQQKQTHKQKMNIHIITLSVKSIFNQFVGIIVVHDKSADNL